MKNVKDVAGKKKVGEQSRLQVVQTADWSGVADEVLRVLKCWWRCVELFVYKLVAKNGHDLG